MFDVTLDVAAEDVLQTDSLVNMAVHWTALDANGTEVSSGTAQAGGNRLSISGEGAYDGTLRLLLSDDHRPTTSPASTRITPLNPSPSSKSTRQTRPTRWTNRTSRPFPTQPSPPPLIVTRPPTNGTATPRTLSSPARSQPKSFRRNGWVLLVIPGTPPPVELVWNEAAGPSVTVDANGNVDLTFSLVQRPDRRHVPRSARGGLCRRPYVP